eukprot:g5859.t1
MASRLTVAQLREQLAERGLPTSGLKAVLVERLEEYEAALDDNNNDDPSDDDNGGGGGGLTRAEVAEHSKAGDLWVIIDNTVYDLSAFLKRHPGGTAPLRYAGLDASAVFRRVHQAGTLERIGRKFIIGELAASERRPVAGKQHPRQDDDGQGDAGGGGGSYDVAEDPDGYDLRVGGEGGREFGDHMSSEGSTSHIPTIILIMYGLISAWSWLTAYLTGCSIWTIPLFYCLGMIAFYLW